MLILSSEDLWREEFSCYYITPTSKQLDRHVAAVASGNRDTFT